MKARKRVVGIFLLIVALCLGVGFAALTDTLLIDGNVAINTEDVSNTFDEAIKFATPNIGANPSGKEGIDAPAVALSNNDDTLTITTVTGAFSAVGQEIVATVNIVNTSKTNDANVKLTATKSGVSTAAGDAVPADPTLTATTPDNPSNPIKIGSFEIKLEWPDTAEAGTEAGSYKLPMNDGTKDGTIVGVKITIKLAKLPTANEKIKFQFELTATAV